MTKTCHNYYGHFSYDFLMINGKCLVFQSKHVCFTDWLAELRSANQSVKQWRLVTKRSTMASGQETPSRGDPRSWKPKSWRPEDADIFK